MINWFRSWWELFWYIYLCTTFLHCRCPQIWPATLLYKIERRGKIYIYMTIVVQYMNMNGSAHPQPTLPILKLASPTSSRSLVEFCPHLPDVLGPRWHCDLPEGDMGSGPMWKLYIYLYSRGNCGHHCWRSVLFSRWNSQKVNTRTDLEYNGQLVYWEHQDISSTIAMKPKVHYDEWAWMQSRAIESTHSAAEHRYKDMFSHPMRHCTILPEPTHS